MSTMMGGLLAKAMPTDNCTHCSYHYWFYTKIRDDYFCGNPKCNASGDDCYHSYQQGAKTIPTLPTEACTSCNRVDWHPYEIFDNDYYCQYCWDYNLINRAYSKQRKKTVNGVHQHVPGMTPIRNPKKENRIYVICRDCGDDLEEFNP